LRYTIRRSSALTIKDLQGRVASAGMVAWRHITMPKRLIVI
jgi:hypothetical protein